MLTGRINFVACAVEYGPLLLLTELHFFYCVCSFPTIVIFASGSGIATAAAVIESPLGVSTHLSPAMRKDIRLYYAAPNRTSLCLTDR